MSRRPLAGVPEIAEYLGIPQATIRNQVMRRAGVGSLAFRVGRFLRWDWDDVDAWIESQKKAKQAA